MSDDNEACHNCRFFANGQNVCRRNPPDVADGYPKVNHSDWCGEWEKKNEP